MWQWNSEPQPAVWCLSGCVVEVASSRWTMRRLMSDGRAIAAHRRCKLQVATHETLSLFWYNVGPRWNNIEPTMAQWFVLLALYPSSSNDGFSIKRGLTPANQAKRTPNAGSVLGQRHGRCHGSNPIVDQCFVKQCKAGRQQERGGGVFQYQLQHLSGSE